MTKRSHSEVETLECEESDCEFVGANQVELFQHYGVVHPDSADDDNAIYSAGDYDDAMYDKAYKKDLPPERREKIRQQLLKFKLEELRHRYTWMVWAARYGPEYPKLNEEVQTKYPEEHEKLENDPTNFEHGFNSGMLSCVQLINSYLCNDDDLEEERGIYEDSNEELPSLEQTLLYHIQTANEFFPHISLAGVSVLPL